MHDFLLECTHPVARAFCIAQDFPVYNANPLSQFPCKKKNMRIGDTKTKEQVALTRDNNVAHSQSGSLTSSSSKALRYVTFWHKS